MSVRLVYQDIAVGADEDAAVTSETAQPFSDLTTLPFGTAESALIATLERNQWKLDGKHTLLGARKVGFWSLTASDANGRFASPPPAIQISFDEQYTSMGLYLSFDQATGEYCNDLIIQWFRGDTLLDSAEYHPGQVDYFCERSVVAYNRIVIQFLGTSLPNRFARVNKIQFGVTRTFRRDELRRVKLVEEADIISSSVAINTLDYELDSKQNVEYMFQLKQPVYAYDNDTLIGVYYIDGFSRTGQSIYSVSCIDAIGVLDESNIGAKMLNGYSAKTLLEEILDGHFVLDLDAALQSATLTGYLPTCTRREALQQVAAALCAIVDTSGTDAVRVYKLNTTTPAPIPAERTYMGGKVDTDAIVTAVQVTAHSYSTTGSGSDTVEVDGTTYYHTAAVTTISNPAVTATDKQNVVEVKEATLVNPSNVAEVAQHVYDYYMRRNTHSVKIIMAGEKPGDYVETLTPWGTKMQGHIARMDITLSGIAAASCTVKAK